MVLRSGLRGVRGLRELSQVRVEGVVAEGSTADTLIVNAPWDRGAMTVTAHLGRLGVGLGLLSASGG